MMKLCRTSLLCVSLLKVSMDFFLTDKDKPTAFIKFSYHSKILKGNPNRSGVEPSTYFILIFAPNSKFESESSRISN